MKIFLVTICILISFDMCVEIYGKHSKISLEEIEELERMAAEARRKKYEKESPLKNVYKMYLSLAKYGHSAPKLREKCLQSLHLTNSSEEVLYNDLSWTNKTGR